MKGLCVHDEEPETIRILIVDDHKVVREGLRMLIESRPHMRVVGLASNGVDALALAAREKPEIVLLDLDLGDSSGLDFFPELLTAAQGIKVLVLTGVRNPEQHQRAIALGAVGLVRKEEASEMLLSAIEKVHAGEAWLDHRTTAHVLARLSRPRDTADDVNRIATLTMREREIITVICEGLNNSKVAERLFISEGTVRNHLTSILSKLGLNDRFELALYSFRHGLARPPQK